MTPELLPDEVIEEILSEVIAGLEGAKESVLAAQLLLPRKYPELAQEGVTPTRTAVLHGDLSILLGALDAAISQARTAATGVQQEMT